MCSTYASIDELSYFILDQSAAQHINRAVNTIITIVQCVFDDFVSYSGATNDCDGDRVKQKFERILKIRRQFVCYRVYEKMLRTKRIFCDINNCVNSAGTFEKSIAFFG